MKKFLSRLIIISLTSYALVCLALFFFQESLLFIPTKLSRDYVFKLPNVKEVSIDVPGATLSALHFENPDPEGIVFFLHGNAGSLDNWLTSTTFYEKANYDLFMIDYRGFGKSTGTILSEKELMGDVEIAWNYILPKYQDKVKVVYGRSLGTALAAELSVKVNPDITVLVSPYFNMSEMAKLYYPWVPDILLRYSLDTARYVAEIKNPIYIFHGDKDQLIPLEQSERLAGLSSFSTLITVPGAMHDDIHLFDTYTTSLLQVLKKRD
jgi:pimeloyl-ACP methyl ester carboxylesterase